MVMVMVMVMVMMTVVVLLDEDISRPRGHDQHYQWASKHCLHLAVFSALPLEMEMEMEMVMVMEMAVVIANQTYSCLCLFEVGILPEHCRHR